MQREQYLIMDCIPEYGNEGAIADRLPMLIPNNKEKYLGQRNVEIYHINNHGSLKLIKNFGEIF